MVSSLAHGSDNFSRPGETVAEIEGAEGPLFCWGWFCGDRGSEVVAGLRHPGFGVGLHLSQLAEHLSPLVSGLLPGGIALRVEVTGVAGGGC